MAPPAPKISGPKRRHAGITLQAKLQTEIARRNSRSMPSATFTDVRICSRMCSPQSTITWPAPSRSGRCTYISAIISIADRRRGKPSICLIERSRRHESIFLKGNHEAFLFEVLQDASRLESWKQYGGFQTLMSYGLTPSIKPDRDEQNQLVQALLHGMPSHHRRFFSNLRPSFFCGDFFFAHAGVKPGVPLRRQREEDLLWIRDEFLRK